MLAVLHSWSSVQPTPSNYLDCFAFFVPRSADIPDLSRLFRILRPPFSRRPRIISAVPHSSSSVQPTPLTPKTQNTGNHEKKKAPTLIGTFSILHLSVKQVLPLS